MLLLRLEAGNSLGAPSILLFFVGIIPCAANGADVTDPRVAEFCVAVVAVDGVVGSSVVKSLKDVDGLKAPRPSSRECGPSV